MPLKRDTHAFLEVIQSNKGIIYKVANSYCKDEENRKDLIQEIVIQLWLSFSRYNEEYKITTWMYRIALNVSISYYRKEHRRHDINQPLPEGILYFNEDQNETRNADLDQLNVFIKELREIDRAIMILYLEENSQQEIADILGITITNVSTKVSRIKEQLREKFSNLNKL